MRTFGIGTKLLIPVTAVFVIFTIGLGVLIGYTSLQNLTMVKLAELDRMSNILANNVLDMAENAELIARSMEQNERISREVVQLATYGPYYADPGAYQDPFEIANRTLPIDDAEQIFALQAHFNLITQLQAVLQTNDLSSVSFYLSSPYDLLPGVAPALSLWLDHDQIVLSRYEAKGSEAIPNYYRVNAVLFDPPGDNYFDISSVYSLSPNVFYADRQFQPTDPPDTIQAALTLPPGMPRAAPQTNIIYQGGLPVLQTSYHFKVNLPHPETWERQRVPAGVLVLQQDLGPGAVADFQKQLGLDVGFVRGDDILVSSLPGPADATPYYTARQPVLGTFGDFGVIVFSPRAEVQALINTLQWRIVIIAGGTLFLGGVVVYVAIQMMVTRPLRTLTESTHEIEKGELGSRVPLQRRDELGQLARAFNTMASRLEELVGSLEGRIHARTRDLKAAIDLSRQITTVLKLEDLLPQVVQLTTKTYGLHAVSVLLPDEDHVYLTVAATTDGAFRESIAIDTRDSIIAEAARARLSIVVNHLDKHDHYLVSPHAKSELAIPMMLGKRFLGVFDVQSRDANGFGKEEINALEVLAKQTAIAIRNAQLFEELREAHQRANEANQAKTAFLASVSHELRTPLNSIINFTEFVKHGMMGPVNTQQVETLGEVTDASQHLLSLINDVLDMSKIESGSLSLYVEDDVNVTDLLETATHTARNLTHDKPVEVVLDVPPALPTIRADEQRVLQIFLNIVSNASKFTESGQICIQACTKGDNLQVSIADTGPGIPPEHYQRVFEKFQQSHAGIRDGNGTGLGMPISKVLAEAHGGALWFESTPGRGTTFYVRLPVASEVLKVAE